MRLSRHIILLLFLAACQREEPVVPDPEPEVVDADRGWALALGNPSGAIPSVVALNNYLIERPQYSLAYSNSLGTALWVSWHLSEAWLGDVPRCDCFQLDPLIPDGYFAADTWDYSGSGFDRGHLCPSADRDASAEDNAATFYMANIMPQSPTLNQETWADLESYARSLVADGNELYITAGGYGSGGTGTAGSTTSIAGGNIVVPARYWKVMVVLPDGRNDLSRISASTRVIAVDMPNDQGVDALPWHMYRTSVDAIEAATGLDLLNALPAELQEVLEVDPDDGPV